MSRFSSSDEPATLRRMALAPGLLGATTALLGVLAIGTELFFAISFVIAVVALIVGWFVVQSRQWWWLPIPAAIAVLWNPAFPFLLSDSTWLPLHYLAAAAFIAVGLFVRTRSVDQQ